MNLEELFRQVPAERHRDIMVSGDTVFVKDKDGNMDEYLIKCSDGEEELWLVHSDRELRQSLEEIKNDLAAK